MTADNNPKSTIPEFLTNSDFLKAVRGYSGWGKFQAVILFISASNALFVGASSLFVGIFLIFVNDVNESGWIFALGWFLYVAFMIFVGIFSIFMGIKLWQSTEKVKQIQQISTESEYIQLSSASISSMRSFFRLQGIMTIISFTLIIIFFVVYIILIIVFAYSFGNSENLESNFEDPFGSELNGIQSQTIQN